ncbi:MAG TPA: GNAT family N-acetyltransferase [Solirubrobacterales bacterium]|nr:GNAT family N-acetyltransferase [Solirubrobacterales bacterium]
MEVRPATMDDCEAIGAGMKVVVDEGIWLATEEASAAALARRFQRMIGEGDTVLVLVDEEEIVGMVDLHPQTPGVVGLGMWVLPSHRGRGGGRMLLRAAIEARPADVHKIGLEVFPENEAAVGLYRSLGFEQEGLLRDHYRRRDGSLRSALVMALHLRNA